MMEPTSERSCPRCGTQAAADAIFCPSCGAPVTESRESVAPVPYFISPARIVLMSIASFGIYNLYWLYKTWKHYKEHTGEAERYPIWHALTLFVPIYGSFRAHAHFRTFGELASRAGLDLRIVPGLAFAIVLVGWLLGFFIAGVSSPEFVEVVDPVTGEQVIDPETGQGEFEVINPTQSELITALLFRLLNIALGIWMVFHAQIRINYYWGHVFGHRLVGMALGKGEILILVLGAIIWFGTLTGITSA